LKERDESKRESFGELSASFGIEGPDGGYEIEPHDNLILSQMDMKMIQYINEKLKDKREAGYFALVDGESIENKVKCFIELLSLHSKDAVSLSQAEPFGDIIVTQR